MNRKTSLRACGAVVALAGLAQGEPPRYTAVDITGWSPAQLATLPFFKHRIHNAPAGGGVPFGFTPTGHTESGYVIGRVDQGTPYQGTEAILLEPTANGPAATYIDPFGTYSWGYWSCDSTDCHYYFGYVRTSSADDINWTGTVVGSATIPGSGQYSSGAILHAYRYTAAGGRVDLFPGIENSSATAINNRGEITGVISGDGAPFFGGYRLSPDGTLSALDPIATATGTASGSPRRINGNGMIIGAHYPSRAFVSPGSATTVSLADLGGFPAVYANDLNDLGWVVGKSANFNDPESYATIWEPGPNNTWEPWDLVEQLDTVDVLLENALVIDNEGNIIATGHLDGTDNFGSRLYWLMPDQPLDGWCRPDIGQHPVDTEIAAGAASFAIQVVNTDQATAYQWHRDGQPIDPAQNPSAATPTLSLAALSISDAGARFDCVVSSNCGTTTSVAATLTGPTNCNPADLAAPLGQLTFADISAFLAAFSTANPTADLAAPLGQFTFADISAVLAAYTAGCP